MAEDVAVAAPSSAPVEAPEANPFEGNGRAEFMKTGKLPEAPKTDAPAASEPGKQASEGEKPGNEPAPESGIKQEPKPHSRKLDAESRIAQLARENADLKRRLETPAAPSTAAPEVKADDGELKEPNIDDYKGATAWDDYQKAMREFSRQETQRLIAEALTKDRQEREVAVQREAIEKQNKQIETDWSKRVKEFTSAHPEAKDFYPAVEALADSGVIPPNSFLDQWILHSESGPALAWHFSQNPDEISRIGELHPTAASRELAKLEMSFESKTAPAPKNNVTVLPKPPNEVSGRNATSGDEVEAAVKDGDFASFRAKQNARELAASRK